MRLVAGLMFLLILSLTNSAFAEPHYQCTFGQKERYIRVVQIKPGQPLPCEVRYVKDGESATLWQAEHEAGYCERKADAFLAQHREWGWRCQALPDMSNPEIDQYQRRALLSQALATATPFKLQVTEYAMVQGHYPDSLEALGLNRTDMRDSQHLRDLRLAEGGRIMVLMDARLGELATLELAPRTALGGMSTEWQCRTNVPDTPVGPCEYDPGLSFD